MGGRIRPWRPRPTASSRTPGPWRTGRANYIIYNNDNANDNTDHTNTSNPDDASNTHITYDNTQLVILFYITTRVLLYTLNTSV